MKRTGRSKLGSEASDEGDMKPEGMSDVCMDCDKKDMKITDYYVKVVKDGFTLSESNG